MNKRKMIITMKGTAAKKSRKNTKNQGIKNKVNKDTKLLLARAKILTEDFMREWEYHRLKNNAIEIHSYQRSVGKVACSKDWIHKLPFKPWTISFLDKKLCLFKDLSQGHFWYIPFADKMKKYTIEWFISDII